MGIDELTGEYYDSDDEDEESGNFIVAKKIDGSGLFFRFPEVMCTTILKMKFCLVVLILNL